MPHLFLAAAANVRHSDNGPITCFGIVEGLRAVLRSSITAPEVLTQLNNQMLLMAHL